MDRSLKDQLIQGYLARIKEAVSENRFFFVQRKENKNTLLSLAMNIQDVKNCIAGLSLNDYVKGPEDDHDGTLGQIWVFRYPLSGCLIYIKLKLFKIDEKDYVKVLSFHT